MKNSIVERDKQWGDIVNVLGVEAEVELFRTEDEYIIRIMLGKKCKFNMISSSFNSVARAVRQLSQNTNFRQRLSCLCSLPINMYRVFYVWLFHVLVPSNGHVMHAYVWCSFVQEEIHYPIQSNPIHVSQDECMNPFPDPGD